MDDFSVKNELNGNVAVVTVTGRVDSATAVKLDEALAKVVRENNKIVMELKDVAYISSAGIRSIVKALQIVRKSDGGVKLASASEPVETVLRTVGMMQMLRNYPSVEEAVASF